MGRGILKKKKNLTSGDRLVDWLFNRLIDMADKKVGELRFGKIAGKTIKKVGKHYEASGDLGRTHLFLGYPDMKSDIEIEYRMSERSKGRIFMHELIHILFKQNIGREQYIRQLENYLWPRLCEEQKQVLIKKVHLLRDKSRLR